MEQAGTESVYRGDISRLLAKVADERGLDLTQYRCAYVERRIAARLRALNLHTYRQYSRFLDTSPEEYAKLLDALTINVTDFFRDQPVYQLFRTQVVPEIIARKMQGRRRLIRVWSAGCATGEEPYSLTMAFLSALGKDVASFLLTVTATDLDPNALERGRKAEYDIAKLKHIPKTDQVRFCEVEGDKFRIRPEVTSHVKFRTLNLFTDEPIHAVDVIFCRNVFIYFTREQQAKVLSVFAESLTRGGYLVLGRSEKLASSAAPSFELVSGRDRVYRRK
jgi:chemotaxis methyl-accepting protein methylase